MKLESLVKVKSKRAKTVGRGPGSGRGKTAGRGTKGQNARGKLPIGHSHYEGGTRPLFKRLPYRRGKSNPKISKKPLCINLEILNILPRDQLVDLEALIKYRIVEEKEARRWGVKILGGGELKVPLTVKLPASKSAVVKIQKAKGKVI